MAKHQAKPQKQPYSTPKLTDHGDTVKETKGVYGVCWEVVGSNEGSLDDDP